MRATKALRSRQRPCWGKTDGLAMAVRLADSPLVGGPSGGRLRRIHICRALWPCSFRDILFTAPCVTASRPWRQSLSLSMAHPIVSWGSLAPGEVLLLLDFFVV